MITRTSGRVDDHRKGRLLIHTTCDSDIIVTVREEGESDFGRSARFCTLVGGGRSPRILKALRELRAAIDEQNELDPHAKAED